jgi:hypothetical protein
MSGEQDATRAADLLRGIDMNMAPARKRTTEVAELLGVTHRQLHWWVTNGYVTGFHVKEDGGPGEGVAWLWTAQQIAEAAIVRDHLDLANKLRLSPDVCGPHCGHGP